MTKFAASFVLTCLFLLLVTYFLIPDFGVLTMYVFVFEAAAVVFLVFGYWVNRIRKLFVLFGALAAILAVLCAVCGRALLENWVSSVP